MEIILWLVLWTGIPAALLYPVVLWIANHTDFSDQFLGNAYIIAIGVLFLPTAFLVDFIYRKFILKKKPSN